MKDLDQGAGNHRFFRSTSVIKWLVVSTPLKNISQLGLLIPINGKIKNMFQTTSQELFVYVRIFFSHDTSTLKLSVSMPALFPSSFFQSSAMALATLRRTILGKMLRTRAGKW
jgi:hypothetical protein